MLGTENVLDLERRPQIEPTFFSTYIEHKLAGITDEVSGMTDERAKAIGRFDESAGSLVFKTSRHFFGDVRQIGVRDG
jgi:hypothetical protein